MMFFNRFLIIMISTCKTQRSKGGIVPWEDLKKEIIRHLKNNETVVTALIDYYGIYPRYNFPKWNESEKIADKSARMDLLENAMKEDIPDDLRHRFIPYYQLHGFEGLLFNNLASFEVTFDQSEFLNKNDLKKILNQYRNPELINDNPKTAPSKRLEKLIKGYDKIVYGSILAKNIGIDKLRKKSPGF